MYAFDPTEDSTKSKATKASRAEDIIDVSYILDPIRVISHSAFEKESADLDESTEDDGRPTFFIRKAMNAKAEQGEGWFYDIEWQDVYERALTSGNWELQTAAEKPKKAAKAEKGKKAPPTKKGKQATPKKIAKKAIKEISATLPVPVKEDTPRASRQSSVDTEMQEASSEDEESSSSEDEASEAEVYAEDGEEDDESEDEGMLSAASSSDDEEAAQVSSEDDEDDVFGSRTASGRKRKGAQKGSTPKKRKVGTAAPVLLKPSAATVRKAKERAARQQQRLAERQARRLKPRQPYTQPKTAAGSDASPFERARAALHVGCTPDYLPCRDEEYAEIEAYLEDAIDEGVGSCICKPYTTPVSHRPS